MVQAENKPKKDEAIPCSIVFREILKALKLHALKSIAICVGRGFMPSHIQWVVTMPSVWNKVARAVMKTGAYLLCF